MYYHSLLSCYIVVMFVSASIGLVLGGVFFWGGLIFNCLYLHSVVVKKNLYHCLLFCLSLCLFVFPDICLTTSLFFFFLLTSVCLHLSVYIVSTLIIICHFLCIFFIPASFCLFSCSFLIYSCLSSLLFSIFLSSPFCPHLSVSVSSLFLLRLLYGC